MRLKVDHVTVCGADLADMRHGFAEVGLVTSYGGPHANGLTHMDLLVFPDGSYLELIAPIAGSLAGAQGMMATWAKLMEENAGAGAWAVRSADIRADAARLKAAGIEVRGPEAGGRQRSDGVKLEWETATIGPGAAGSLLPFMIQDKTERGLRVPPPESPSPIEGVAGVVLGVRDLEASIALFRNAYQWETPRFEKHVEFGKIAFFQGTPVALAAPPDQRHWLTDRVARFGECPAAFLLDVNNAVTARERFAVGPSDHCFGRQLGWFDETRMRVRLGVNFP